MVSTSFATYLIFHNASHLIDDAQTLTTADIGTNPTHSQLAKDHDVHHFHAIAAEVAKLAVAAVGTAMYKYWRGDKSADPVAVAKTYIVHPLDNTHADIDARLKQFAVSNPAKMKRSESWTIYEHLEHEGEEQFENVRKSIAEWNKRYQRWIQQITDYFSGK